MICTIPISLSTHKLGELCKISKSSTCFPFFHLQVKILGSSVAQKCLTPGRVILVTNENHHNALGVILKAGTLDSKFSTSSSSKDPLEKKYIALLICDKIYELRCMNKEDLGPSASTQDNLDNKEYVKRFLSTDIYVPEDENGQIVEEITAVCIEEILDCSVTIDAAKIIDNHKRRLIPRFR